MKIRKNHAKKRYRYNVNRKTLNKTRKNNGAIKDPYLKKMWEDKKRPNKNFNEMGLSSDPNKTVPIPNYKTNRLKVMKLVNGFAEEELDEDETAGVSGEPSKSFVVKKLEEDAKAPRESQVKLPKGVVKRLKYFLDKHQFNYKAMVADRQNHDQWTWKQFRMNVHKFQSIPDQWNKYLETKNLKPDDPLPWTEYESDSEWR